MKKKKEKDGFLVHLTQRFSFDHVPRAAGCDGEDKGGSQESDGSKPSR